MLKKVHLYLIKPTQYDDDGYVVRHWRGVLPSNTLACLAGLTDDVIAQKRLGEGVRVKVYLLDETVDKIPVKRICRSQRWGAKTIVCMAGVQTNHQVLGLMLGAMPRTLESAMHAWMVAGWPVEARSGSQPPRKGCGWTWNFDAGPIAVAPPGAAAKNVIWKAG